jgi:uncharacterized membrane protein
MKTFKITLPQPLRQHFSTYILAAFCVSLLLVRAKLTHSVFYFFLIWNLFLAYVPLGLSTLMIDRVQWLEKKLYFYPLCLAWLLLLPNAPYIITDFIHLKKASTVPVWFDVLLLISFSVTGLLFGLASMKHMFSILVVKFSAKLAWIAMAFVCLLSGLGIYVGRFMRYNSWDILHKPLSLITDVADNLTDPALCRSILGITLGFGMLMFLLFHLYNNRD